MIKAIEGWVKNEINEIKSGFTKKDVLKAVIGISIVCFLQYLNHNFV